jgi:hypothetical protein
MSARSRSFSSQRVVPPETELPPPPTAISPSPRDAASAGVAENAGMTDDVLTLTVRAAAAASVGDLIERRLGMTTTASMNLFIIHHAGLSVLTAM